MLLSEVLVKGFRCLGGDEPLTVPLQAGINLLVGENDSGKTALVDAIRFTLGTRGETFDRISPSDFYHGPSGQTSEFHVRCTFVGLSLQEQADFVEWTTITPAQGGAPGKIELHVNLRAKLQPSGKIYPERRTGKEADGKEVEGALREYLQATYLRPLRDATAEMSAGRRSRLAQILQALPEMQAERDADAAPTTLAAIIKTTQDHISANATIKDLTKRLDEDFLSPASLAGTSLKARIEIGAGLKFEQILERLALEFEPPAGISTKVGRGLGLDNVLFMCAELLLLQADADGQLPLLLVEEPEAHLHPQLQASVVEMLKAQTTSRRQAQIILTTHSPLIAAGAEPDAVIMCISGRAYPMSPEFTALERDDYRFLGRFLDATKANLFFAKGVLIVEGDAEALLLPALAEKCGKPLWKYGVSIVKVGHTGLFRYARIFQRKAGPPMPIPVACLTDRDIPPDEARDILPKGRGTERDYSPEEIADEVARRRKHEGSPVRIFVSPRWTLEFDLAAAGLLAEVNRAIVRARHRGSKTREALDDEANGVLDRLRAEGKGELAIAAEIYAPLVSGTSKAVAAEELAEIILGLGDTQAELRARLPVYIVEAIDYVTEAFPVAAVTSGTE